jgi:hypothetical protein
MASQKQLDGGLTEERIGKLVGVTVPPRRTPTAKGAVANGGAR